MPFALRWALKPDASLVLWWEEPRGSSSGVMVGLGLALATNRLIAAMLFGINTTDIATYTAVLLAMLPVITLAPAVPAIRAARVDPITALRMD